jgi:hypothetical protein
MPNMAVTIRATNRPFKTTRPLVTA